MSKYKVWIDNQEQWDLDDIAPGTEIESATVEGAAEQFADQGYGDGPAELIVLAPTGDYHKIELRRGWTVAKRAVTTLEELCAP